LLSRALSRGFSPLWASRAAQGVTLALFAFTLAWGSLRARTRDGLIEAGAAAALVYFLVVSGRLWPWYSVLPIGLLCARLAAKDRVLILALSAGALLGSPLSLFKHAGILSVAQAGYFFAVVANYFPLLAAGVWLFRRPAKAVLSVAAERDQRLDGANCTTV
jgi:hypothetical protein